MDEALSDVGEFGFLARLRRSLASGRGVVVGPGDDAAALSFTTGRLVLATTDMLCEGVHFDLALSSPEDVGYKSIAASVSDIAAMGGIPRFALVALGTPPAVPVAALEALAAGVSTAADAFDLRVAGGDLVRSDALVVSVAVLGEQADGKPVLRSGARSGDVVCVTGALGEAAAGLALLRASGADERARSLLERFPSLAAAHRRGRARPREGRAAAGAGATAMIDCSDGLGADAAHIAEESGTGLAIEAARLPLGDGVAETASWLGRDAADLALFGGEDYELIVAVPRDRLGAVAEAMRPTPLTPVGELTGEGMVVIRADGRRDPIEQGGWDHFRAPQR